MTFRPIDLAAYPRREHYEHFLHLRLTYSATVSIDISALRLTAKERGIRIYPAQIWMLTTAADHVPEFRMDRDENGNLGIWDHLEPLYTVMRDASTPFSGLWTPYIPKFGDFYRQCLAQIETYANGSLLPQGAEPPNALNISSIPWIGFTGFHLHLTTDHLLPILTIGRHTEQGGDTLMPLAIQVHHAVCDGYHLGRFVEQVQAIADSAPEWLVR
jgi:chloramphenicol O-acetyltransferase type A